MANDSASPKRTEYLDPAKLKELRKAAGLTQEAVALKVGTTQRRLAHWETDEGCGIEMIVALANELGCVSPEELMHPAGVVRYREFIAAIGVAA